jgi:fission 1 protein
MENIKEQLTAEETMDFSQELAIAEEIYRKETPTIESTFAYAICLIRSKKRNDKNKGIKLLQGIIVDPKLDKELRRSCFYYMALGLYRVEEYTESRKFLTVLLNEEPNNMQAQALNSLIEDKITKDGLVGVAVVGSIAAVLTAGAIILGKALSKK